MATTITYTTRRKDVLETNRYISSTYASKSGGTTPSGLSSEYYTKLELQTNGSASVNWGNLANKPFVDVKDFGATGDGVTDDYASIIAAIDSLDSSSAMGGGGVIFFPEGTYLIRDEIELHDRIGMSFIGIGEKTIIHADGFNGRHFKFVDCTSIHIENMKLVGDTIDSSLSVGGIWFNLSGEDNNAYHVLKNLYITDITNTGVTMNTPILTVLENVVCRYCLGDSFFFYNGTSVTLTACFALTSTECGFNFYQMTYCTLNSCAAEVNGVCYNFENSKAIVLNGCGAEDPIYRSATFPGYSYQTISGSVVTAIACYSRGADAVGDPINETSGTRFDKINFKDNDVSGISHITKIHSFSMDEDGNTLIDSNLELGSSGTNGQIIQHYYTSGNAAYRGNWTHNGYWGFGSTGSNNIVKLGTTNYAGIFTDDEIFQFQVEGNILLSADIGSTGTFVGGFAGSGWRNVLNSGSHTLTVDHLIVRKSMSVYELVINQIRATNGALWISDCAKINGVLYNGSSSYTCTIDTVAGMVQPFAVNDIIRCQKWNGTGVKYFIARVTAIDVSNGQFFTVLLYGESTGIPTVGDDVVRVGNTTDADRQGAVYITSSDDNAPYIDVLDGVNTVSFDGCTKVRLGKLNGITDSTYGALTGYGLYSENVYLTGYIKATSGYIGGFTLTTAEGLYSGTGATRVQMKPGVGIWCGATAIGDAPFSVTNAGYLKSTSGLIGGWTINSGSLSKGYITLSSTNEEIVIDDGADLVKLTKADPIYGYPAFYAESGTDFYSFLNGAVLNMEYTYSGNEKVFKINMNSGAYISVNIKGLTTNSSSSGLYPLYINRTTGEVYSVG
jgi:hypothetical protein